MGADLRGVKKKFASLMECVQPMITSQFVVWLDEKVSEFKVQGCMNFDISLDAPKWIRDYSMSMLVSGGNLVESNDAQDVQQDEFPPPRRGDLHSNASHKKLGVDFSRFRDQGISQSRISSGDSVRKRGSASTQDDYDIAEIKRERLQDDDDDDDDITVISANVSVNASPRHSAFSTNKANSANSSQYSISHGSNQNVHRTVQRTIASPASRTTIDSNKRTNLHGSDPLSSHSLLLSSSPTASLTLPLTTQVFTNIRTTSTQSSSVMSSTSEQHTFKAIEASRAPSSHSSDRDQDVSQTDLDMGIESYEQDDQEVDEFDDPVDRKDSIELIETGDMPLDSQGLPYSPGSHDLSGSGDGYGDMAGPSTSDASILVARQNVWHGVESGRKQGLEGSRCLVSYQDTGQIVSLISADDNNKRFRCIFCAQSLDGLQSYSYHLRSLHIFPPLSGEGYTCPLCLSQIKVKTAFVRHCISHSRLYTCEVCKGVFNRHDNYIRHIRIGKCVDFVVK